jgi:2,3-bisphosphoglycerate-independent phosphoglycerate mutase
VVLVIMDGWGNAPPGPGNAVTLAATPTFDRLVASAPRAELIPFGREVGLPEGQMGNSEVGHLNLGAGRIVYQTLTRIDLAIEDGTFMANPALLAAVDHAKRHGSTLHLLGLIGPGGVHAQDTHVLALLPLARARGLTDIAVHAFLDGRDTPPESARGYMATLEAAMRAIGVGRVATVSGRYYAMDRDKRWERVRKAYDALTLGAGETARSADEAIARSYAAGVTDEFVLPTVIVDEAGKPLATIADDDAVIFFNFRSDRARQLSHALLDADFSGFPRAVRPRVFFVSMTEYEAGLPVDGIAFPTEDIAEPLAAVIAAHGLAQFHAAETEKYPHVTFFFNGGREPPFPGEDRQLIPSPKVATYDLQPEMSAPAVADAVVEAILSGRYAFVLVNFANPDMVGHTGVLPAAINAVETVDGCVGRILAAVDAVGGAAIVTADHGNAEEMIAPDGTPMTAHTMNPVPVFLTGAGVPPDTALRPRGRLADIAPTILQLLGLPRPAVMTGESLIA